MNTVLKLLGSHAILYPLERCFKKEGILKYPGDFTNKLISIACISKVIQLGIKSEDSKELISFLMKYFIYDVIYICSSRKTFKHNYIFIIHHLFTAGLCYLGHDQKFGNGVFLMFETTDPARLDIPPPIIEPKLPNPLPIEGRDPKMPAMAIPVVRPLPSPLDSSLALPRPICC